MRTQWDPAQYLRNADHRARPFLDLLARLPEPGTTRPEITDLGCGTADTTTALLHHRWPAARITGIDSSQQMLDRAAAVAGPTPDGRGRLDLRLADILDWTPEHPQHLILSNAAYQWVPGHLKHFPRWIDHLTPGGTFAFQVPGNHDQPTHTLLRTLADSPHWRERLAAALPDRANWVHRPVEYLEALTALDCRTEVWETTYLHELHGPDPVLEWTRGTALRPVLTALGSEAERAEFTEQYGALLREAYPAGPSGTTVLPFRRIFAVATRTVATRSKD
jgi:trans-aconitate 2-methyltransferase